MADTPPTVLSWFPFRFSKHLKETMTLDTTGQGALLLLKAHYYSTLTAPRDNDRTLASITKLPAKQWSEIRQDLLDLRHEDGEPFFEIVDGAWVNAEIEAEILDASSKHAARSAHGKAAAEAKYGKRSSGDAPGKPTARSQRPQRTKSPPGKPPAPSQDATSMPGASPSPPQEQEQLTTPVVVVNRAGAKHDDNDPKAQDGLAGKNDLIGDRNTGGQIDLEEVIANASAPIPFNPLGTALPEDWVPDDQDQACAREYGMTDDDIKAELLVFHAMNAQNGTFSQNWKATWQIFCARFKERAERKPKRAPARVEVSTSAPFVPTTENWEWGLGMWQTNQSNWPSKMLGPTPGARGCKAPKDLMRKYGIDPETGIYRAPAMVRDAG